LAGPYCPEERNDVFISGTQPAIDCRIHSTAITQFADRLEDMPSATTAPRTVQPASSLAPNVPSPLPSLSPHK
jgi:hypothetical protein